jgi:hypothetical protein
LLAQKDFMFGERWELRDDDAATQRFAGIVWLHWQSLALNDSEIKRFMRTACLQYANAEDAMPMGAPSNHSRRGTLARGLGTAFY